MMRKSMLAMLCALGATACAAAPAATTDEQLVARGEYLVTAVAGCNDCHTPMTPQGPDMTQSLHGATIMFAPTIDIPWADVAPPLAGGPANMRDDEFAAFLQTGVRPDGSQPRPPMPHYAFTEDDARAVVAYIKTLPSAS